MSKKKFYLFLFFLIVQNLIELQNSYAMTALKLPDTLTFAGQKVPLEDPFVREHFDLLFTTMAYNQKGQLLLWYKRANRYIPIVKKILQDKNLPTDLAYIMVAESDLVPRALSPSSAYGIWQFIPSTGEHFGLKQIQGWDERGDFFRATDKAIQYLTKLYKEFNQDWFLAMAAYNCGPTNLKKMLSIQKAKSYWESVPNRETNVYVPRIILIKTFFDNPSIFGVKNEELLSYPQYEYIQVQFQLEKPIKFAEIGEWIGISYRTLYWLNPHIFVKSYLEDATLPQHKPLFLNIPKGKGEIFNKAIDEFNRKSKASSK
ncbi:MAG: lytic transglycosylase domain-containing protein [bacterium]|nr:lytic transglycosylase domain-containing protein [bacterium]